MVKTKLVSGFCLFFICFLCIPQVAIKLELNKKRFILYENIFATVLVRNLSSHPLVFGKHKQMTGMLFFNIKDSENNRIKPRESAQIDFMEGVILEPGRTTELTLSLSQLYALNKSGKYEVNALIKHSQLSELYISNTVKFNILQGRRIWEASVGVPAVMLQNEKKKDKIKKRKYELKTYFDGEDKVICLIVSDDKYIYGVARIGVDLGNEKPECLIDNYSRIHILIQSDNRNYNYYVYDINCNLDERAEFTAEKSTPNLTIDEESGKVEVSGGEMIFNNNN
ncbi:MAG: hypothetical protein K9M56_08835 [Victivallales bacterium]|nr:hypothetical protein [Victivallales bacterium]